MGFFDRFKRKSEPVAPASPQASGWIPAPHAAALLHTGGIVAGRPNDPDVIAVDAAVENALRNVFGAYNPLYWFSQGVPTYLLFVRVCAVEDAAGPYLHYLTCGLTELGSKSSPRADVSGFGIELTLKLRAQPDEIGADGAPVPTRVPVWPFDLLERYARAIDHSGRPFGHDHWVQANGTFGPESIGHVACANDPKLSPVTTPNGRFQYIQLYPIDSAELDEMKHADAERRVPSVHAARIVRDPQLVIARTAAQ